MESLLEYYEKSRAIIKALGYCELDDDDRDALLWILDDLFSELGKQIRTVVKK